MCYTFFDERTQEGIHMPTKQPRLNIVLEPLLYKIIVKLADDDGVSLSLKARDVLRLALEYNEDLYWMEEAYTRDKTFDRKKALSHKDVWEK